MTIQTTTDKSPKELGSSELCLYLGLGVVHSLKEFIIENKKLIENKDYSLIIKALYFFIEPIPTDVNKCITRSPEFAISDDPIAIVKRSGARSAYWQEKGYKFKGCRPTHDHALFPMETLTSDSENITYTNIPFGVLTRDAIMSEILAFAFQIEFKIKSTIVPLCIYEYFDESGNSFGYCLVQKSSCEQRIEEFIDYPEISIGDVIEKSASNRTDNLKFAFGKELGLKGINNWWYAEEKARILTNFHFNGGFRGILNSNIGNDIIYINNSKPFLFLCDFDTFKYIEIPRVAELDFLKSFVLRCIIEVSKGSLSILEFINTPENASKEDIVKILSHGYFAKSTLWKAYKRLFYTNIEKKGWNINLVEEAFNYAIKTQAFLDVVALNTLNSYYLDHLNSSRNIYYPHN